MQLTVGCGYNRVIAFWKQDRISILHDEDIVESIDLVSSGICSNKTEASRWPNLKKIDLFQPRFVRRIRAIMFVRWKTRPASGRIQSLTRQKALGCRIVAHCGVHCTLERAAAYLFAEDRPALD